MKENEKSCSIQYNIHMYSDIITDVSRISMIEKKLTFEPDVS